MAEIVNTEQAKAWNGTDGTHWTAEEANYNRAIARHFTHLVDAARIAPSERVLDIGCGVGQSTREAARAARDGSALGVDLSTQMLERARELASAEGLKNVRFEQADAQVHPFEAGAFDIAISRFGVMFFGDPRAAFRNINGALASRGRLAMLVWQPPAENPWTQALFGAVASVRPLEPPAPGAPGPFAFGDPADVQGILGDAGFTEIAFKDVREPMWFGDSTADAMRFMGGSGLLRSATEEMDASAKERVMEELRGAFASREGPEGVTFDSATWLITARKG
jgi:SAM-dependent methyltransferase